MLLLLILLSSLSCCRYRYCCGCAAGLRVAGTVTGPSASMSTIEVDRSVGGQAIAAELTHMVLPALLKMSKAAVRKTIQDKQVGIIIIIGILLLLLLLLLLLPPCACFCSVLVPVFILGSWFKFLVFVLGSWFLFFFLLLFSFSLSSSFSFSSLFLSLRPSHHYQYVRHHYCMFGSCSAARS